MRRKHFFAMIVFVLIATLCSVSFADVVVGVKSGDWIEYKSTFTGNPGAGHDISSAKMDILDVQGPSIAIYISSVSPNGTREASNATLNLQTGYLIDAFIIPANLNAGDTFYDQALGNVTLTKEEQHQYLGTIRTVLYGGWVGPSYNDTYIWDRATGVCVEGISQGSDFTMHNIVSDTNMWQPIQPLSVDFIAFLGAVAVIIVLLVIALALRYKRAKHRKQRQSS